MKFQSAEQMLKYITDVGDLYSEKAEIYIFNYNEAGSVCTYNIDREQAAQLSNEVNNSKENYWAAFLGVGGQIWDDPTSDYYEDGCATNLDCCESLVIYDDWLAV